VAAALLATLSVAFLAVSWSQVSAHFGDSDEGINGAVWGYGSRALREAGVIDSRLGGIRADGTRYANHPPLIVVETAAIELVVGEHPWSTRAPAWLGALATIPLLYLVLRSIGLDEITAAAATCAGLGCHMFLVYGSMLDTMVTALPFAMAVVLVWCRQWYGTRAVHWVIVVALALLASLSGWQAMFLVGLCGSAWLLRLRSDKTAWRQAIAYLVGAVGGLAITLLWARWVYGGLEPLTAKLGRRSGGSSAVSIPEMIGFQLPWLGQLLGLGLLAWIACAISIRDRRFRPLAVLSLTAVIAYAVLFREGSGGHQYWNYWGLIPSAVGIAYVFDAVAAGLRRGHRREPRSVAAVLGGVAIAVTIVNLVQTNDAGRHIDDGQHALELAQDADYPVDQTSLPYLGEAHRADDWLKYNRLPAGDPIQSSEELRQLAHEHPTHLVLVLGSCAEPDPTQICGQLQRTDPRGPRMVPADELLAAAP
jgi:4-amino-4-deoxy-L-arabinose transferase-like glycosyltransferase